MVICFYNEDEVTLLRSVRSVLDRSPSQLLSEIILIDDSSDDDVTDGVRRHIADHGWHKVRGNVLMSTAAGGNVLETFVKGWLLLYFLVFSSVKLPSVFQMINHRC